MLVYPAGLDVSTTHLRFLAGQLRARRRLIGTRWRRLWGWPAGAAGVGLLSGNEKAVNWAHAKLRAHGERANAQLKTWRVLRRVRMSPEHTTDLVHSVTALIHAAR